MAEINVTPFVDVVLVLLIIFMITAGVFDFGIDVEVPKTREVASSQKEFPFVNITKTGEVYYNTEPIAVDDIAPRLEEDFQGDRDAGERPGVYLRADAAVPWEAIAPIVENCGAAGVAVNMVTKPLERNPSQP
jgi:biopolymer transport protein ExbD